MQLDSHNAKFFSSKGYLKKERKEMKQFIKVLNNFSESVTENEVVYSVALVHKDFEKLISIKTKAFFFGKV